MSLKENKDNYMERFEGYEGKRNNVNILWSKKELVKKLHCNKR